jgi:undecaprenyl diphosphate synthase
MIETIDKAKLPKHIAIIMDGNGRWAKSQGMPRVFGHKNGITAVREVTEACAEIGISYLTLYAFSTENWSRPPIEVNALMTLLIEAVKSEIATLHKNNIKLSYIGDISKLPQATQKALLDGVAYTQNNTRLVLTLALNYSSRWEIVEASKKIGEDVKLGKVNPEMIDEKLFSSYLSTRDT